MHSSKKRAHRNHSTHKQTLSVVLMNRCSENMLQVYRRTYTPKTHFNKVTIQFAVNRITGSIKIVTQNQLDDDFASQGLHFLLFYIYITILDCHENLIS